MSKLTTIMAIPRHPEVPAPSVDDILLTMDSTTLEVLPTYDGGWLVFTTIGVAYLPVPWDTRTWIGIGIGGLGGLLGAGAGNALGKLLVEETGKAIGENVRDERVVPDRIRASLRRRGSFAAGYAEIVRVEEMSTWTSGPGLAVEISKSGEVAPYRVFFKSEVTNKHIAAAAQHIADYRALAEGVFAWEDAMFSLEAAMPAPVRRTRDGCWIWNAAENIMTSLTDHARTSGLATEQVVHRALELHPSFMEFERCPATNTTFRVFTQFWG